jgi:GMP synthase-like glutamine amidotransferase
MTIHHLQHVSYEKPGYIKNWARERHQTQTRTLVPEEQGFPDVNDGDLVVVLGGPMSVYEEEQYPWLLREKSFLNDCLHSDVKLLGLCLGAQLIADVLGADVYPMDGEEKGWHPITWTDQARVHRITNGLPHQHRVFHWHGDTFDVPDEGVHLASSEPCRNQAFLVPGRALGLQFHLEITEEIIRSLLSRSETDSDGDALPAPVPPEEGPGHDRLHEMMCSILDAFYPEAAEQTSSG